MLPYAIYLRKSRGDPEDESIDVTLAKHREILFDFAKRLKLPVSEMYFEVVSGDGLFVRPQMLRLIADIEKDMFSGVICMDIDRLGRVDTKDRGIILDTFKEHNTKIITPSKTYDLSDEIDEFSTEMQMLFARQELKKITKRMRIGINKTVSDGYHVGEPPYGYRRTYVNKKPSLEICEEEAKVIQMVFDMYVNKHIGSESIARTLNSMGYAPRKNTHFSRTTIQFYLSNPIYIGKIVYNKTKKVKKKLPTDKHRSILNPESEWIVADGKFQPIIDKDLFDKAQMIKAEKTHPPAFTGAIMNPLAGLVRCANCGEKMMRQTSKKTPPRLLCNTVGCCRSTLIENVESIVFEELKCALDNAKVKPKTPSHQIELRTLKINLADLKRQQSQITSQMNSLYDLLEQGVYDIKLFTERSKVLTDKQNMLDKLISDAQKQLKVIDIAPLRKSLIPLAEKLIIEYETLSAAERNQLYKQLIDYIEYSYPKDAENFTLNIYFKAWV